MDQKITKKEQKRWDRDVLEMDEYEEEMKRKLSRTFNKRASLGLQKTISHMDRATADQDDSKKQGGQLQLLAKRGSAEEDEKQINFSLDDDNTNNNDSGDNFNEFWDADF